MTMNDRLASSRQTPPSARAERSLYERLTTAAGAGIIIGRFDHECRDEDVIDVIGGQQCRVCGLFVDDPS